MPGYNDNNDVHYINAAGEAMKVVRISANNVKVAFSESELERYGLEITSPEGECCAPKGTVKKILEAVKSESGIDYCGERVFIRLVRARGGGCDLLISRLGIRDNAISEDAVIRFGSVGSLIAACRTMDKGICADAYVGIGGAYLIADRGVLTGYGETVEFSYAEAFVREHCRLVAEKRAIDMLGKL